MVNDFTRSDHCEWDMAQLCPHKPVARQPWNTPAALPSLRSAHIGFLPRLLFQAVAVLLVSSPRGDIIPVYPRLVLRWAISLTIPFRYAFLAARRAVYIPSPLIRNKSKMTPTTTPISRISIVLTPSYHVYFQSTSEVVSARPLGT
jgi:hypothetical protein